MRAKRGLVSIGMDTNIAYKKKNKKRRENQIGRETGTILSDM